jgi:hypothetical protein
MKLLPLALTLSTLFLVPAAALAQSPLMIMGSDGTFLGVITPDKYAENGICNQYGTYGSKYADNSIFNQYGVYGGKFSDLGAYSEIAQNPPVVVQDGRIVGIISKNPKLGGKDRADPDALMAYVCSK